MMLRLRFATLSALACACGLALAAREAPATGAWTTWLKAYSYSDLLAERDTLWCATGEAGLLRYERGPGTFTRFTREPGGLASNALSVLARDRSRRLWVGTVGSGVSRLLTDGASWDLLNRFDGLPSDTITALAAVGDTVWIGTTGGLALWNGHVVTGALPDGVNPSPFANNWMTGIVQHGDSLWVTTQVGMYVSRISTGLTVWVPAENGLPAGIDWVGLASDGTALFAVTAGGTIVRRTFTAPGWLVVSGGIGKTWRLDQSGTNVIASTSTGIFVWNGAAWNQINDTLLSDGDPPTTYAAAIDPDGRGWAANRDGIHQQPAAAGAWIVAVPPGPPGNFILNLDLEGSRVYVSTNTEGVGRFDGTQWRNWPPVPCSFCDTTFTIPFYSFGLVADRRGHKWFGQWQVAVEEMNDHVDPPQFIHHYYSPPPLDLRTNSWAAAVDSTRGGVWFGMDTNCLGCTGRTPLGLLYYSGLDGSDSLNLRQDSLPQMRGTKVHGLTVDRTGRVWVGYTGEGIQYFDWPIAPNTSIAFNTVANTGNFDIRALESRGDTVWAMTTRDVRIYYRPIAAFVDSFLLPSVPADLALRPLAVGPDGAVYVGTTVGMRVRKLNGSIEDFNESNSPIAGNAVQAIRVDPATGAVWIGTASGLSRYDPSYRPPLPPPVPSLHFTLYPNPAHVNVLGNTISLSGISGVWRGAIYDLTGRQMHKFAGSGSGVSIWDGRDGDGNLVRPGIYFVRVEAGGSADTKRIAILR